MLHITGYTLKNNLSYLPGMFFFFFLNYISDSNKTRKKHSTYHITWGASVVQRANNPGTKNKTIILGIANEYVLYGIVYSI